MKKKKRNNILNFLKTGSVHNINIGDSESIILKKFSKKLEKSFDNQESKGFYLDTYELQFYQSKLSCIAINKLHLKNCYLKTKEITMSITSKIDISRLLNFLNNAKIEWSFKTYSSEKRILLIQTESKVNILVDCSETTPEIAKILR